MKTGFKFAMVAALVGTMFFTSCKKDSTTTNNSTPAVPGIISCKINGTAWSSPANVSQAMLRNDTLGISGGQIANGDTSIISMNIVLTSTKTGKYSGSGSFLGGSKTLAFFIPSTKNSSAYFDIFMGSATYEINITKFDLTTNKVSGTFSFTQTRYSGTKDIVSEGTFTDISIVQ